MENTEQDVLPGTRLFFFFLNSFFKTGPSSTGQEGCGLGLASQLDKMHSVDERSSRGSQKAELWIWLCVTG